MPLLDSYFAADEERPNDERRRHLRLLKLTSAPMRDAYETWNTLSS
jgi:hypothetical protein